MCALSSVAPGDRSSTSGREEILSDEAVESARDERRQALELKYEAEAEDHALPTVAKLLEAASRSDKAEFERLLFMLRAQASFFDRGRSEARCADAYLEARARSENVKTQTARVAAFLPAQSACRRAVLAAPESETVWYTLGLSSLEGAPDASQAESAFAAAFRFMKRQDFPIDDISYFAPKNERALLRMRILRARGALLTTVLGAAGAA